MIIGVAVLAAGAHDNEAGIALLNQVAERCGTCRSPWGHGCDTPGPGRLQHPACP
ncbi:hypothetical protein [Streptomyces sp. NPDC018693]|uniref:hypothetical protein n=1 Tax=unclassified Streptomyces TaxID=2593676 RepID=UPI00378BB332